MIRTTMSSLTCVGPAEAMASRICRSRLRGPLHGQHPIHQALSSSRDVARVAYQAPFAFATV